ncbi:hypothetical protein QCE63_34375 [Caballeronia sp. LZ065]|uniref:hypothetical protein n=1 Tax=Caballeronia sp. LZ065 TaxID=3038571 RepID=UPI002865DCEA|nr:hypothetical protein [Caballeronia sp. LZ065]MDR5784498.1 hypothetical protein [Caballeronia sp. LZ065]
MNATATVSPTWYSEVLPLLTTKVAARQLDVNYRFSNVSIRDQMVRAQMVVKALISTGVLRSGERAKVRGARPHFQLAIFGAGIAGIAAAMQAEKEGIRFVLVDNAKAPSGILKSKAQRYVSAAMYEWPHENFRAHEFPLATPPLLAHQQTDWAIAFKVAAPLLIEDFANEFLRRPYPGTGKSVDEHLSDWRTNHLHKLDGNWLIDESHLSKDSKARLRKMLAPDESMTGSRIDDQQPIPLTLQPNGQRLTVDYTIYAVGFGHESATYSPSAPAAAAPDFVSFWEPDQLLENRLGTKAAASRATALIVGAGDGALQDALRCMVNPDLAKHPLEIWSWLTSAAPPEMKGVPHSRLSGMKRHDLSANPDLLNALRRIAAIDGYTTMGMLWVDNKEAFKRLDAEVVAVINGLPTALRQQLADNFSSIARTDVQRVTILRPDDCFTKAYALNRFLVYLLHVILPEGGAPYLAIREGTLQDVQGNASAPNEAPRQVQILVATTIEHRAYDRVVIRIGVDRSMYQKIGLSGRNSGRIELGRIPPPIVPVTDPAQDGVAGSGNLESETLISPAISELAT